MLDLPNCPQCGEGYTYKDNHLYVCPMCFHEWTDADMEAAELVSKTFDFNGAELSDGDSVTTIKELPLGKDRLKQGTRATKLKILKPEVNGHDIEATVDGVGRIYLKSKLVKKIEK